MQRSRELSGEVFSFLFSQFYIHILIPADEWIRNLSYIYTMEYYSAIKKNSFETVLMRWMKLEPIIQSEVSQKDKDHYSILIILFF